MERDDIGPDTADSQYNLTPLWWVVDKGHEGVVKLLLGRGDVDPNTKEAKYGRTPLLWAAEQGLEGVIKLLLERDDIDPNTRDTIYHLTPLLWAVECGHERVVKLLLEHGDLDPEIPGPRGLIALEVAAFLKHAGIVQMFSQATPSLFPEYPAPKPSKPHPGSIPGTSWPCILIQAILWTGLLTLLLSSPLTILACFGNL